MNVRFTLATVLIAILSGSPLFSQHDSSGIISPETSATSTESAKVNESEDQDWGPAPEQGDLRLRLTLKANEVKEGLPVLASLEIKNFGENAASYDWQNFRTNGPLSVKHVDGDSDLYVASSRSTAGNSQSLQPGQSEFIWEDFDIGTAFMLDQGEYKVQVIGTTARTLVVNRNGKGATLQEDKTSPESNIQTLKISNGQQTPRKRFMKSFIAVAPNWWKVTYNSYGMTAQYYHHLDKRPDAPKKPMPVGFGKVAPPQISFKFVPVPLAAEDVAEHLTPLGNTEMGYLYVRSGEKIAELWPDHITKIQEAAKSIKK